MNPLRSLSAFFRRAKLDREMDDELRFHVEEQTRTNLATGMSPHEAALVARKQFGWRDRIREDARDARGALWFENVSRDVRHAARSLGRSPGFTGAAIATLALALAANGAMLSFFHTVVVTPLPVADSGRLIRFWSADPAGQPGGAPAISRPLVERLAARTDLFDGVGVGLATGFTVTSEELPGSAGGMRISSELLAVLGLEPKLGRNFSEAENQPGGPPVVIVSHEFWQSRLGGRAGVIGSTLGLDSVSHEIIGVMPPGAGRLFANNSIFVPRPYEIPNVSPQLINRGAVRYQATARLRPGITIEQIAAFLPTIAASYRQDFPSNSDASRILSVRTYREELVGSLTPTLLLLGGVTLSGLLIAGSNLGGLFLARLLRRRHEIAVRSSLGASRARLISVFACEAILVTTIAAIGGLIACSWILPWLNQLAAPILARIPDARLSGTVVGGVFTLAAIIAEMLVCMTLPQLKRVNLAGDLKADRRQTPGRSRLRGVLVTGQVSVSLALLITASLLVGSLRKLQHVPLGFRPEGLATGFVNLPPTRYNTQQRQEQFYRDVLERLASEPGVRAAATVGVAPMTRTLIATPFSVAGRDASSPDQRPLAINMPVSENYFATMGMVLSAGRGFAPHEGTDGRRVCVISASLARRYFADRSPIGETILTGLDLSTPIEIIGVAADVPLDGVEVEPPDQVYVPLARNARAQTAFVVRAASGDGDTLQTTLRRAVAAADPAQSVAAFQTFDTVIARAIWQQRLSAVLTAAFSGGALLIALVSLQSLLSFWVAQRTHEIGVRMSLGATRREIVRLVLREGARHVAIGIVLGLVLAALASRAIEAVLFQVGAYDPRIFAAAATMFAVLGGVACVIPALRAARTDPMIALRAD